jgi:hypothetical protein
MANDLKLEQVKIKNIKTLIDKLHQAHLYTIARVAVFQDPLLAEKKPEWAVKSKTSGKAWRDRKGLAWLDTSNPEVWKYHVDIAKEAINLGFDEINLDYVRFPSDGAISDMSFPYLAEQSKADALKNFFAYFYEQTKDEPAYFSVDLFGLTTTVTNDMKTNSSSYTGWNLNSGANDTNPWCWTSGNYPCLYWESGCSCS